MIKRAVLGVLGKRQRLLIQANVPVSTRRIQELLLIQRLQSTTTTTPISVSPPLDDSTILEKEATTRNHQQQQKEHSNTTRNNHVIETKTTTQKREESLNELVRSVAHDLRANIRRQILDINNCTITKKKKIPCLVGILTTDAPPDAQLYSNVICKTLSQDGLLYRAWHVHPNQVENAIQSANRDSDIHAILVFYPIFDKQATTTRQQQQQDDETSDDNRGPYKNRMTGVYYKTRDDHIRDLVHPHKDVEGLCHFVSHESLFSPYYKRPQQQQQQQSNDDQDEKNEMICYPCAALAVYNILKRILPTISPKANNDPIVITIVNRSAIFGRPLAIMLTQSPPHNSTLSSIQQQQASVDTTNSDKRELLVYSIDATSILLFSSLHPRVERIVTHDRNTCFSSSHVIVTAVPRPDFELPLESLQSNNNVVVVDVSQEGNVNVERAQQRGISVIRQHVGQVTVASLAQNVLQLYSRQEPMEQ